MARASNAALPVSFFIYLLPFPPPEFVWVHAPLTRVSYFIFIDLLSFPPPEFVWGHAPLTRRVLFHFYLFIIFVCVCVSGQALWRIVSYRGGPGEMGRGPGASVVVYFGRAPAHADDSSGTSS
jgi:hypothetical protein